MWSVVAELAPVVGAPVTAKSERDDVRLMPSDLLLADEVFLAGTSCGVIGIVRVDNEPIGSGTEGPITRQIRQAYRRLTRGPE